MLHSRPKQMAHSNMNNIAELQLLPHIIRIFDISGNNI